MAANTERAERLKAVKELRPDLTWRQLAEAVGVTERSVHDWAAEGGITWDHAQALCAYLDIDLDWFWRGTDNHRADAMDSLNPDGRRQRQLDAMERQLREIREAVERLEDVLNPEDLRKHFPRQGAAPNVRAGSKPRRAAANQAPTGPESPQAA